MKTLFKVLLLGAVAAFAAGVAKELHVIREATKDPDGYDLPKAEEAPEESAEETAETEEQ